MAEGIVYKAGWTLDRCRLVALRRLQGRARLLAAVKGASLVEHNAPDYVGYLKRVFDGAGEKTLSDIEEWGREEIQHGRALAGGRNWPILTFVSPNPSTASAPATSPRISERRTAPSAAAGAAK